MTTQDELRTMVVAYGDVLDGALEPSGPRAGADSGDPQTSGGLLIAVEPDSASLLEQMLQDAGIAPRCIGVLHERQAGPWVEVT